MIKYLSDWSSLIFWFTCFIALHSWASWKLWMTTLCTAFWAYLLLFILLRFLWNIFFLIIIFIRAIRCYMPRLMAFKAFYIIIYEIRTGINLFSCTLSWLRNLFWTICCKVTNLFAFETNYFLFCVVAIDWPSVSVSVCVGICIRSVSLLVASVLCISGSCGFISPTIVCRLDILVEIGITAWGNAKFECIVFSFRKSYPHH